MQRLQVDPRWFQILSLGALLAVNIAGFDLAANVPQSGVTLAASIAWQDLIVLALTERGRVETVNYPTRRVPTGIDVPLFVKDRFGEFYRAVFDRQFEDSDGATTFLEYAWQMGTCDPCSASPPSNDELRELGADWAKSRYFGDRMFVTRLHVRYDRDRFP